MLAEHMRTVHKTSLNPHEKLNFDFRTTNTLDKWIRGTNLSPTKYSHVERETLCCDKCQKDFSDVHSFEVGLLTDKETKISIPYEHIRCIY